MDGWMVAWMGGWMGETISSGDGQNGKRGCGRGLPVPDEVWRTGVLRRVDGDYRVTKAAIGARIAPARVVMGGEI